MRRHRRGLFDSPEADTIGPVLLRESTTRLFRVPRHCECHHGGWGVVAKSATPPSSPKASPSSPTSKPGQTLWDKQKEQAEYPHVPGFSRHDVIQKDVTLFGTTWHLTSVVKSGDAGVQVFTHAQVGTRTGEYHWVPIVNSGMTYPGGSILPNMMVGLASASPDKPFLLDVVVGGDHIKVVKRYVESKDPTKPEEGEWIDYTLSGEIVGRKTIELTNSYDGKDAVLGFELDGEVFGTPVTEQDGNGIVFPWKLTGDQWRVMANTGPNRFILVVSKYETYFADSLNPSGRDAVRTYDNRFNGDYSGSAWEHRWWYPKIVVRTPKPPTKALHVPMASTYDGLAGLIEKFGSTAGDMGMTAGMATTAVGDDSDDEPEVPPTAGGHKEGCPSTGAGPTEAQIAAGKKAFAKRAEMFAKSPAAFAKWKASEEGRKALEDIEIWQKHCTCDREEHNSIIEEEADDDDEDDDDEEDDE